MVFNLQDDGFKLLIDFFFLILKWWYVFRLKGNFIIVDFI